MTEKVVLLLGSGVDSVTLLYDLINQNKHVHCIIFDYGQKAQKEVEYAIWHCKKLEVEYTLIDFKEISNQIWDNTLINSPHNLEVLSWDIPSRNSIFIEIATAFAITNNFAKIYIGLIDTGEEVVPDSKWEFIYAVNDLNKTNNQKYIPICTPYKPKNKYEIIKLAYKFNIDLNYTWSCFFGEEEECGECMSCKSKYDAIKKYEEGGI